MDMQQHQGSMVMIYDEIASLYEQVEKPTEDANRKTLLTLHGGGEWTRATKTAGSNIMRHTHLNYTGFLQPEIVITLFNQYDLDGSNDRHCACLCVDLPNVLLGDLATDVDPMDLGDFLLTIYNFFHHEGSKQEFHFQLSAKAYQTFERFYNNMALKVKNMRDNQDHWSLEFGVLCCLTTPGLRKDIRRQIRQLYSHKVTYYVNYNYILSSHLLSHSRFYFYY